MTPDTSDSKPASIIVFIAGLWLFVSPWPHSEGLSWLNVFPGVRTFVSPWIFGFAADGGRLINNLCTGAITFVAALVSANAMPRGTHPTRRSA